MAPLFRALGFRADYSLERFVRETEFHVAEAQSVNVFGYWTLLRMVTTRAAIIEGVRLSQPQLAASGVRCHRAGWFGHRLGRD